MISQGHNYAFFNSLWVGWSKQENGRIAPNDEEAEKLVRRSAEHERLHISIVAYGGEKKGRIFEDFNISEVTSETLGKLCFCEQDPNPCVEKQN